MLEKILPVIAMLVALQLLLRFMQRRRKTESQGSSRYSEYKEKIDRFMKISNYDEGADYDRVFSDEIRSGIAKPELIMGIPESMRDVRKGLNLIIDGVNHAVRAKTGTPGTGDIKYRDAAGMFDELVEVIKKHQGG